MNKYKTINESLVLQNIERVLSQATPSFFEEGRQWYWEANDFAKTLGVKYDLEYWKVASIISSLSPMKEWSLNKRITEEFILGKRNIHFSKQVEKAIELFNLDAWSQNKVESILQGQKTVSFYNNIIDPSNPNYVTIDGHILDSLLWKGANVTPQRYEIIESAIKSFSASLNLVPCETQSILWLTHKHLKKVA